MRVIFSVLCNMVRDSRQDKGIICGVLCSFNINTSAHKTWYNLPNCFYCITRWDTVLILIIESWCWHSLTTSGYNRIPCVSAPVHRSSRLVTRLFQLLGTNCKNKLGITICFFHFLRERKVKVCIISIHFKFYRFTLSLKPEQTGYQQILRCRLSSIKLCRLQAQIYFSYK